MEWSRYDGIPTADFIRRYVHGGYSFAPDSLRYHDPASSTSEDWAFAWDEGDERLVTRERYYSLANQSVVLRRGSGEELLMAAELPAALDTLPDLAPMLALGRAEDQSVSLLPARVAEGGVVRTSATVTDADLASLEIVGGARTHIGRVRTGIQGPTLIDGFGVSVPALVDVRFEADGMTVEDALLPSRTLPPEGEVGLYWEVYGASKGEGVEVALEVEPVDRPGFFGRVLGAIGLRSRASALDLSWSEPTQPEEVVLRRFFSIDASSLPEGEVRLTLSVRHPDGRRATATTLVTVGG